MGVSIKKRTSEATVSHSTPPATGMGKPRLPGHPEARALEACVSALSKDKTRPPSGVAGRASEGDPKKSRNSTHPLFGRERGIPRVSDSVGVLQAARMEYEVKLESFEGPLDLLLHLIHKNEMDIFDIPIATITDQYLEYIDMMKALNIDVAGDFLVMASTLMHIKSRMLLPQSSDADGEEEDPRMEITRPLLEYMRYKELAGELSDREILERDVFARGAASFNRELLEDEEPSLEVNLFQLMEAFKKVVVQNIPGTRMKVEFEKWSVKEKMEDIIASLRGMKGMYFQDLFKGHRIIGEFIATFLGLLELVHVGLVRLSQATDEGPIWIVPQFGENGENGDEPTN